jgi:hypothetical protein
VRFSTYFKGDRAKSHTVRSSRPQGQRLSHASQRLVVPVGQARAHFLALNLDFGRRFDPQADGSPRESHDRDDNVATDDQTLILLPRQN